MSSNCRHCKHRSTSDVGKSPVSTSASGLNAVKVSFTTSQKIIELNYDLNVDSRLQQFGAVPNARPKRSKIGGSVVPGR